jgi:Predicted membrane protein (DUF2157)
MNALLDRLLEKNIISSEKTAQILEYENQKSVSIFWELRSLLYLGISCLSGGLGMLIYQNIDTIGHSVLIGFIAILCLACFWYSYKHRVPFTWHEAQNVSFLSEFSLLGACVLFLVLEGYLQYQYNFFGERYGLVTFIPAVLFFGGSYFFDHRGILSMAITSTGSWLGLSIAPKSVLKTFDIINTEIVYTGIAFGILLVLVGWLSEWRDKKKHFSFTYYFFGANVAFISTLTALFSFEFKFLHLLLLLAMSGVAIFHARQTKSYLLLLMGVVYGYIGITYFVFSNFNFDDYLFVSFFYFMISCGAVVYFLFNVKSILGISKTKTL